MSRSETSYTSHRGFDQLRDSWIAYMNETQPPEPGYIWILDAETPESPCTCCRIATVYTPVLIELKKEE